MDSEREATATVQLGQVGTGYAVLDHGSDDVGGRWRLVDMGNGTERGLHLHLLSGGLMETNSKRTIWVFRRDGTFTEFVTCPTREVIGWLEVLDACGVKVARIDFVYEG